MDDRSWIARVFGHAPSRTARSRGRRGPLGPRGKTQRPGLEALEDRLAPATLTVDSTADTASPSDPYLSLREAIAIVNSPTLPSGLSAQILAQISGTLHAGHTDRIVFDPVHVSTPIVLGGTQLELSLSGSTATVTIAGGSGITVDGNDASRVLQLDSRVQATLDHLSIIHGSVTGSNSGGGILNSGTVTVSNSTLESNSSTDFGGGIYNLGTLTMTDCTLSSNSSYSSGGGIRNDGMLTVSNSTLSFNSVGPNGSGGGIINVGGTLTVSNSTLTSNSVYGVGAAGAIFNSGTGTVSNSTLSSNSANEGGGIYNYADYDTLRLHNTLVANNRVSRGYPGPDISGSVDSSSSYNLIGSGNDLFGISNGVNHNLVGIANSGLAPLNSYGGPTQTIPLLPGSPARAAGDPTNDPATDQRGLLRVVAGHTDIGAFQTQADPFLVTTLLDPGHLSGLLSLREAVALANVLPGANTVSFAGTLGFGTVTLTAGQLVLSGTGGVQTIDGGSRFTLSGNNSTRLFQIAPATRAVLTNLALGNGNSSDNGGAVLNQGTLTLSNSTLFGNAASSGGAVYNSGTLTLSGSTLEFNVAFQGGGLYNAGALTAFNSTFVYNSGVTAGGAIYNAAGGSATLTSLSISRNSANSGGGLDVAAGAVLLRNCIVAGNYNDNASAASDVAGTVSASSSYNLIGTGGSGGLINGVNYNLVGVADPGLTTPDFFGGLTPVFGFTATSPALGAGDPMLLADPLLRLDQHGNPRHSPVNIGAL